MLPQVGKLAQLMSSVKMDGPMPATAISLIRMLPTPATIAFGGVPTGRWNEKLHTIATGNISTGSTTLQIATFEVNSVRNSPTTHSTNSSSSGGSTFNPASDWPSRADMPEVRPPSARANPPPSRNSKLQGVFWLMKRHLAPLLTASSSSSTACTIGHIIATVAVLEIHIETNIVTMVRPKYSTASAITIPPMNISIVSFMYIMHVLFVSRMPISGNSTIGSMEVMGSGSASVIQNTPITITMYMQRNGGDVSTRKTDAARSGTSSTSSVFQYTPINRHIRRPHPSGSCVLVAFVMTGRAQSGKVASSG
uniref:Uncharacterized protein n=1 Tax=Anopheles merus TaxID=30066 RepID=A0A182UYB2_ANOME